MTIPVSLIILQKTCALRRLLKHLQHLFLFSINLTIILLTYTFVSKMTGNSKNAHHIFETMPSNVFLTHRPKPKGGLLLSLDTPQQSDVWHFCLKINCSVVQSSLLPILLGLMTQQTPGHKHKIYASVFKSYSQYDLALCLHCICSG